ncbi:MAG: VWA domain-containing protein [Bacillati bacterium ANGP1]|uniref:VWA domain-containing protein n=1 Tax=Candidatus Segetimicrobium genomatis TaxID=2569760 RepID=A0A537IPX9_9BACT|nr:MAG: VWA domain-containing protein [Terrabacteria group bacterium ANGP1]
MGAAPARTRAGPACACAHAAAGGVGAVAARTAEGRRHRIPRVTSVQAIGVSAGRRTLGGASVNAVGVGTPAALFLLVLLPVVAALARRRVAPRGALALRLLVVTLIVTALASPYLWTRGGDLTVVFAVDLSDSVPAEQRQAAQEFVRSAAGHRRPGDRVGLVTFGASAITEELPNPQPRLAFATQPVATGTDLGQAIRAALAALPEDGARRIVLLTDGNDNRGGLAEALALARSDGVEVSAVPLAAGGAAEVLVDDVEAPQEVVAGEQFAVKVAVMATTAASVRLTITAGSTIVDRRTIEVPPGRTIVTVILTAPARTTGPRLRSWCGGGRWSGTWHASRGSWPAC